MKSRTSYFSVSLPLVKENLRRFWAIPAIGFLAYFLSGIFPLLMSYGDLDRMYSYIDMCLSNTQPFFMATHLLMPVITAVIIFRFLQSSSSVTTMHAMPFTRAELFNSSILSGFILILLPLLANEVIFQMIAKPTYDVYMYEDYPHMTVLAENAVDIFTRSGVLQWFWQSLLILLVIYAISIFAGMVTGNSVMHLALAVWFNFLAPALYLTFITYCTSYLFGFTSSGIHEKILMGLSPFIQTLTQDGISSLGLQLYYLFTAAGILVLSAFLYQRRQMEKAGDPLVFHFMIPAICYLITYFGMSLMAYYFAALAVSGDDGNQQNTDAYFYSGLIAGAVIAFILGRMIVLKTPRIFNKQTLKNFGIYAVIAALFISSITLDLTGFEERIPSEKNLRGVSTTSFEYFNNSGSRYSADLFTDPGHQIEYGTFHYVNPKNIQAILSLHRQIVADKDRIKKEQNANMQSYAIDLFYRTNSPLGLQRSYVLTYKRLLTNPYLKQLYESAEFKEHFSLNRINHQEWTKITLDNTYYYDDSLAAHLLITDQSKINQLLAAMETDFQNRTYEEYMSNRHPYCTLYLDYTFKDNRNRTEKNTLDIRVLSTDVQTIQWLRDNSYSSYLECTADQVASIVFTKQEPEKDKEKASGPAAMTTEKSTSNIALDPVSGVIQEDEESTEKQLIITDPVQIQQVLDTFSSWNNSYDTYYQGYISYKPRVGMRDAHTTDIYYDLEDAPDFIQEFFD